MNNDTTKLHYGGVSLLHDRFYPRHRRVGQRDFQKSARSLLSIRGTGEPGKGILGKALNLCFLSAASASRAKGFSQKRQIFAFHFGMV